MLGDVEDASASRAELVQHSEETEEYRAFEFVTHQSVKNLSNYKYSGTDHSLYYDKFASPLAKRLTEYLPLWVAPNLITITGFLLTLVTHVLIFFYVPTLTESYPGWLGCACAITTFLYQTLDNMDGKQARRTGTSSPLGQLFDHGCDSVILSLFALNIGAFLHLTGFVLATVFVISMSGFYVTHWEEFHLHEFSLPIVNGPNEGLLTIMFVCLLAGVSGEDTVSTLRTPLMSLFVIAGFFTILSHVRRTVTRAHNNPRSFDTGDAAHAALYRLSPVILIDLYVLFMCTSEAVEQMPFIFYWTVGLNFSSFDILFMLNLLCDENPRLFPKRLWPMALICLHSFLYRAGYVNTPETVPLIIYFGGTVVHFGMFVRRIVKELCLVLRISVFKIPY